MNIKIEYDGKYPNLCSGDLSIIIDGKKWKFPDYCLYSGGYVSFNKDWDEEVGEGPWSILDWPNGFPDNLKKAVLDIINKQIPHGCCGGCV